VVCEREKKKYSLGGDAIPARCGGVSGGENPFYWRGEDRTGLMRARLMKSELWKNCVRRARGRRKHNVVRIVSGSLGQVEPGGGDGGGCKNRQLHLSDERNFSVI